MPGSISVFCRPFSLSQRLPTGIWGSWSLLEGETPARCVSDPPTVTAEVHEYKFSDRSTMERGIVVDVDQASNVPPIISRVLVWNPS